MAAPIGLAVDDEQRSSASARISLEPRDLMRLEQAYHIARQLLAVLNFDGKPTPIGQNPEHVKRLLACER